MVLTDNMRGAGLMMVSMASFTLNDTVVKLLGGTMPLFQIIFLRGLVTSVLIWLVARQLGAIRVDLPRRDWALIALRSAAEVAATFLFLTALMRLPIASVTAILQALPLTVVLFGALVFGEPLGWRRLVAIALGFAGVMLIVRPGAEGFSAWSLFALGAVACVTVRDLAARGVSARTPSITVALVGALAVTASAGVVLAGGAAWAPIGGREAGLVVLAALFIIGGYLASVAVMRKGEIAFTAPFRYTGLLWALATGWLVFGEWPDALTLTGAALVVAMGVFTLHREHAAARAHRRAGTA